MHLLNLGKFRSASICYRFSICHVDFYWRRIEAIECPFEVGRSWLRYTRCLAMKCEIESMDLGSAFDLNAASDIKCVSRLLRDMTSRVREGVSLEGVPTIVLCDHRWFYGCQEISLLPIAWHFIVAKRASSPTCLVQQTENVLLAKRAYFLLKIHRSNYWIEENGIFEEIIGRKTTL